MTLSDAMIGLFTVVCGTVTVYLGATGGKKGNDGKSDIERIIELTDTISDLKIQLAQAVQEISELKKELKELKKYENETIKGENK